MFVSLFLHALSKVAKFVLKDSEGAQDDILRSHYTSRLNSEDKLLIPFPNLDCSLEALSLSEPHTLNAKNALVCILDLNNISELIEPVDLTRASAHELFSLLDVKSTAIDLVLIDLVEH